MESTSVKSMAKHGRIVVVLSFEKKEIVKLNRYVLAARFLKEFRAIFMTSENEVKISKLDIHSSHHAAVCIALKHTGTFHDILLFLIVLTKYVNLKY